MSDLTSLEHNLARLKTQCAQAEEQLQSLRLQVSHAEEQLNQAKVAEAAATQHTHTNELSQAIVTTWPLSLHDYKRYGRQLILPEIGAAGQHALKHARVLIVGVGGLGCPAAAYLAGAGVGVIGLVDGDTVDTSNLHRQIAHSTSRVGMSKVESAYTYLMSINPTITYRRHPDHLTAQHAVDLFEQYDLVLDCTDHPAIRYLISDTCIITGRTLVSASALKTEGQLIILNRPAKPAGDSTGGPCYRCMFPKPPPPETVLSCGEGGILGPVVGTMGVLQALEAIKVLTAPILHNAKPSMLMFSAYGEQQFRNIRMRSRRADCKSCSANAAITRSTLTDGSMDYAAFCGLAMAPIHLAPEQRVSALQLQLAMQDPGPQVVDVRDPVQFAICSLPGSTNVPWTGDVTAWHAAAKAQLDQETDVLVICRHGNDSQLAIKALQEDITARDIVGGFDAWRRDVDPSWPDY